MFGRKKNNSGLPDDLYEFLTEADALYIRAFETRTITILKDYFTRECCIAISNWIVAEASLRYFSDERYRNTTWTIVSQTDSHISLKKECVYKDIRLSMSRSMKVSDDYQEIWEIVVSPEEFWVESVVPATQEGLC